MELEDKAKGPSHLFGGQNLSICSIPCHAGCFALVYLKEKVEFLLFFQIDRGKTASAARNWANFAPQTDAATFALSSNSILLLCKGCWKIVVCNDDIQTRLCFTPYLNSAESRNESGWGVLLPRLLSHLALCPPAQGSRLRGGGSVEKVETERKREKAQVKIVHVKL